MTAQFKLKITLGNDAMRTGEDIAHALQEVADRVEQHDDTAGRIFDANGNTVGKWEVTR